MSKTLALFQGGYNMLVCKNTKRKPNLKKQKRFASRKMRKTLAMKNKSCNAFLIILLTFAAVFFVEMRKAKPIHPVQYLLVGSVGIFIVLGIAMFATQKIDWYKKKD